MSDGIERRDADGIIELRLDRADKKNAITAAMYRAMTAALAEATERKDIAALMIAGNGDAFCAGNDLGDFLAPGGGDAAFEFIRAIAAFGKPIVAAVQGLAVGIGTTMLLHCDLVYAAPDARFIVPFVNLGIVPEAASSLLLPRMMGHAKAASMLLLGEPIGAEAAERGGLVTAIVPVAELSDHARAKAKLLGQKPPEALAATRRLMKGDIAAIRTRMDEEGELFAELMQSDNAREAFTAFFEKRPPAFKRT